MTPTTRINTRAFGRALALPLAAAALLMTASPAGAIPRDEVLSRAKAFAYHPWRLAPANTTASCSSKYKSLFAPGDYVGLPYDWGGYMSLFTFDQQIAKGYGAGSQPSDGILSCTAGLDCSGYVSRCWSVGHYTTSSLHKISGAISQSQVQPGDVFNEAGVHVSMFSHKLASGEPMLYESAGYNVHVNNYGGWSYVSGTIPRRYSNITAASSSNPVGTVVNPIVIGSLPFTDSRDTTSSPSDMLDGCGAAPSKSETGREFVYKVEIKQPGTLTVSVSDDVGVDIDVHLYTSPNTNDCVARHDTTLSHAVDCGTYYVVADTFRGSKEYPGRYTLRVSFAPASGKSCGAGPPAYKPFGKLGSRCAYPGDKTLPFCNPNLGASTCIYTSSTSFCSKSCKTVGDCSGGAFSGGCCRDIGNGEKYCLVSSLCGGSGTPGDAGIGAVDASGAGDGPKDPSSVPDSGASSGGDAGAGGSADAGAGGSDAGGAAGDGGGDDDGGCAVTPGARPSTLALLLLLGLGALISRRRRCR